MITKFSVFFTTEHCGAEDGALKLGQQLDLNVRFDWLNTEICVTLKKFVARNVAEVGRDSTAAILRAVLRATNFGVDTRCNSAIARNIARNIAPCIRTFKEARKGFFVVAVLVKRWKITKKDI